MGHGKPGKSWHLRISFSMPGNSCSLINYCRSLKVGENLSFIQ